MSNPIISLLVAIGVGAWVYNMFYKRTGGQSGKSIVPAIFAGIMSFMVMMTILWMAV